MSRALVPLIFVSLLGCATTAPRPTPPVGTVANAASQAEVKELRDQIATLTNRVNHLHSEIVAMQPEGEFKRLTIDSVRVDNFHGHGKDSASRLLCHVVEWKEFGRMLRFTRLADPVFTLQADGQSPISGRMAQGGESDDSGSVRFVLLSLDHDPEPGVAYTLHPRNNVAEYTWVVNDGVQFRSSDGDRHAR